MSALPKAVQLQIDTANKIVAEMQAAKNQEPVEAAPAETPPESPPIEGQEEAAAPPEDKAPAAPPKEESTDEHRYKVLQGKYNKEVPRLQDQIRQQDELIRELRQRANNTEALLAALNTTKNEPAKKAEDLITQEEIDQFGPDLIDLVKRVAKQSVLPEVDQRLKPMDSRFKQMEQSTSNVQKSMAKSEREKLLDRLTAAVPTWEQQNGDQNFLDWLDERDPYSGQVRGKMLNDAFQVNDTDRVIKFFEGFQNENIAVTPTTPTDAPKREPHRALEEFVAPGTPKTGTVNAPNESGKRVWTRDDVASFYAKKNEYVKKRLDVPKELMALERDLIKAQHEGRLR